MSEKNIEILQLKSAINAQLDILASDKSISHRVCMFALFADDVCVVRHFLRAEDTLHSLEIACALGLKYEFVSESELDSKITESRSIYNKNSINLKSKDSKVIESNKQILLLYPPPHNSLQTPSDVLYCGNSGTSMRLFTGLLAGANIYSILCGDKYLHARPMGRIINPLNSIGANIFGRIIESGQKDSKNIESNNSKNLKVTESSNHIPPPCPPRKKGGGFEDSLKGMGKLEERANAKIVTKKYLAPLSIIPKNTPLKGFEYHSKISSAQVKSSMILAALQASENSVYSEVSLSRNHTENMLLAFQKSDFLSFESSTDSKNKKIKIKPFRTFEPYNRGEKPLKNFNIEISNDPSSAFFFAVLACVIPHSSITLRRVLLNETRIEAFKILEKMGANIIYENIMNDYEKSGDITIKHAPLKAVEVSENIAWLIDEIPALSIAMAVASGISKVRNAAELRVKESDRISVLLAGLKAFGVECVEYDDGFDIIGFGSLNVKNSKNTNVIESEVINTTHILDSQNIADFNSIIDSKNLTNSKRIVDSKGDHRIAMSFIIMSCLFGGKVKDIDCIKTSFPNFLKILKSLGVEFIES